MIDAIKMLVCLLLIFLSGFYMGTQVSDRRDKQDNKTENDERE